MRSSAGSIGFRCAGDIAEQRRGRWRRARVSKSSSERMPVNRPRPSGRGWVGLPMLLVLASLEGFLTALPDGGQDQRQQHAGRDQKHTALIGRSTKTSGSPWERRRARRRLVSSKRSENEAEQQRPGLASGLAQHIAQNAEQDDQSDVEAAIVDAVTPIQQKSRSRDKAAGREPSAAAPRCRSAAG